MAELKLEDGWLTLYYNDRYSSVSPKMLRLYEQTGERIFLISDRLEELLEDTTCNVYKLKGKGLRIVFLHQPTKGRDELHVGESGLYKLSETFKEFYDNYERRLQETLS